jgi:2-keto-4-pentenoate hydratase
MRSPGTSSLAADLRVRRGMERLLDERRRRLASGDRSLGWKVGFGSEDAMRRLRTDAALVGSLTARSLLGAPAGVSLSGWVNPVLEPEVAVHMGSDLSPGAHMAAAQEAVSDLGPALELADVDPPPRDVEQILAGNIFQRHVLVGPAESGVSPGILRGRITGPGGGERVVDDPQATNGDLVGIVRHVADLLGEFGETLRAGEIVICGSIVPPISVASGDAVSYRLDPLGELSIRFES